MRIISHLLTLGAAILMASCSSGVVIENPRCEWLSSPINIGTSQPRFSWEYSATEGHQKSYRLIVAADEKFENILWDSGKVASDRTMVKYAAEPLESFSRYWWKVETVMDGGNKVKCAPQCFETAALEDYEWQARWITDGYDKDYAPAPMMRRSFNVGGGLKSAKLCISAAAYYKLTINGEPVSNTVLDPGFTDYSKTNLYSTYDITPKLSAGENVIAAVLGNGFYNEIDPVATWDFENAHWRGRARMIAELHLTYSDGRQEVIPTDETWKTATGPYLSNNIYSGDIYDARLEITGWDGRCFDDSRWQNAQTVAGPSANLVSQQTPPVRVCEVVHAVEMKNFGDTLYVFDFGKNIAGVCNLIAIGPAGTRVTMKHGEFTYADGRVNMSNVDIYYTPMPEREMQTDTYYMKGGCVETYTPSFTYHGFRYVEVAFSKPVKLTRESMRAHFTHTDLERVGSFECSNELLNRIYSATCLTYLDNLVSIPTDCPQREKNGWTADANLAIDVALLNYDGFGFYEKWVGDMIDSQAPDGNLPGIVPTAGWGYEDWIGPVWASAFFMIPDALERYSGDITAIERIYPVCEAYLAYLGRRLDEDGTVTYGIGDWVYYDTPTPTDYSTTLFYYHQNVLMARFSELLGKESAPYSEKAAYLKDLVNRKYFDAENCIYANGSQAAEAMALMLGVVPEECCAKVAANLNQSIVDNNYYLDFGSVGSKFVPRVLADYGYAETVYKLMTREEIPSWGAWLNQGLTTLAERWALDMVKFRDSSANHVFLGDISAWMTNYLAGIRYDENDRGFRHIVIKPHVVGDLEWVSATYHSVKGEIAVSWHREGDKVKLKVSIPANTTATVSCPDGDYEVGGGQHEYSYYYNILN